MHQNYFVVNGETYYTGTVFLINYMGKPTEATFICYMPEYNDYVYQIDDKRIFDNKQMFSRNFISVTNKKNVAVHTPETKPLKDRYIEGMSLGWGWYIVLMAISFIFNDRIILWVFISIVFFAWRKKKIKKEGTHIEW